MFTSRRWDPSTSRSTLSAASMSSLATCDINNYTSCLLIALYLVLFLAVTATSCMCVTNNCFLSTNTKSISNTYVFIYIYSRQFDSAFSDKTEYSFTTTNNSTKSLAAV